MSLSNPALRKFWELLGQTGVISDAYKNVLYGKLAKALESTAIQAESDLAKGVEPSRIAAVIRHNGEWSEFREELSRSSVISDSFRSQISSLGTQAIAFMLFENHDIIL